MEQLGAGDGNLSVVKMMIPIHSASCWTNRVMIEYLRGAGVTAAGMCAGAGQSLPHLRARTQPHHRLRSHKGPGLEMRCFVDAIFKCTE